MSRGYSRSNGWILFMFIMIGIILGGFVGELLGQYFPILKYGINLGVSTHTWDLKICELTLGFKLNINMFSVLGILTGIFLYKRSI